MNRLPPEPHECDEYEITVDRGGGLISYARAFRFRSDFSNIVGAKATMLILDDPEKPDELRGEIFGGVE